MTAPWVTSALLNGDPFSAICLTDDVTDERELILRWSAAIREIEVLEPWLTESNWDEHYWDDVATLVVKRIGRSRSKRAGRRALVAGLKQTFPGAAFKSDSGLYRDRLNERIDLIVAGALGRDSS